MRGLDTEKQRNCEERVTVRRKRRRIKEKESERIRISRVAV